LNSFLYLLKHKRNERKMTQEIRHSIDWIQYSIPWPNEVSEWPMDTNEELTICRTCIPMLSVTGLPPARPAGTRVFGMRGYPNTYDMLWASVHVNPRFRSQKIGVRMTGQDCTAYRDLGGSDDRLLAFVKHTNARPSRIDIAFDLFAFKIEPLRIYKDWLSGKVKTRARTVKPFTKSVRGAGGDVVSASTLYIGSRTSPVMIRIYEKGKEQGVDIDWCRVELEVKDDKALAVLEDCVRHGLDTTGKALLREAMPEVPYVFWKELMRGKSIALEAVGRKKTARQAWLESVILPLLADEINREWEGEDETMITQQVEMLLRQNWQRRAVEVRRSFGLSS